MRNQIIQGDSLIELKKLPDESIDCCVTSPPYFGLRDYGITEQIGLEKTPDEYIAKLVEVFTEVRRVLKKEGTLWLNLGDSYNGSGGQGTKPNILSKENNEAKGGKSIRLSNLKPKDLIGIPWMAAFALRASGWYLRQDIIWHKPNPMPESVTDRCTKAHEYIFLFSKDKKYFYDHTSIKTPLAKNSIARLSQNVDDQDGSSRVPGKTNGKMKAVGYLTFGGKKARDAQESGGDPRNGHRTDENSQWGKEYVPSPDGMANKKSVWTVTTKPFKEAHFATFPEDLIIDCIKAGCPEGGIVLDPFMGAGTTALVALKNNRNYTGFELNPAYIEIANKRLLKYSDPDMYEMIYG